jgi:hypothetical protein
MTRKIIYSLFRGIVLLLFLAQFLVSLLALKDSLAPIVENPNRSYEDKMLKQLGRYYELIRFVQTETPPDAVLLIDSASHNNLDLYFLYPRRIVYDNDLMTRTQSVDYIVLTGDMPPAKVEGKRKMLDDKRGLVQLK